jgi:[acyl-carrier-protein] S-malonyltransferase
MDIVLLFPGQGSQKPGMGRDVAEAYPAARAVFDRVDMALGTPLSELAFEGPAEELILTHNAQPALLAHSAAIWAVVHPALDGLVRAAAGHSLGEFTAYHAAGALDVVDAARLVRRRGELMLRAGEERPGAMAALLGDPTRPIEDICEEASRDAGLVVPANYNSPTQLVVSGEVAGVERAMELAKAHGVKKTVRLHVSGAFHSPLMAPAQRGLREALDAADFVEAELPVYANVNAEAVTAPARARDLLEQQLVAPVRWVEVIRALAEAHPDALFVEMGPGAVLMHLVKKIAPHVHTATCGTAAEVEALLERAAAART